MAITYSETRLFRRQIALPSDHGSWVFLFSPLLIGLFAGGAWSLASALVVVAALAAFLLRQPASMAVKAYSGRRPRTDLPAARFWIGAYGLAGLLAAAGLVSLGFGYLLWLAVPALPVFAWHLLLISRRAERRQIGVELVGSGVLGLAATAALWVGHGYPDPAGWLLWVLAWLQSAASIVYAYLRLEQRRLPEVPPVPERLRLGRRALAYCAFNLLAVGLLSLLGSVPPLLALPYAVQFAEAVYGTLRPAVRVKPAAIGIRQAVVSSLFTALFIVAWRP